MIEDQVICLSSSPFDLKLEKQFAMFENDDFEVEMTAVMWRKKLILRKPGVGCL